MHRKKRALRNDSTIRFKRSFYYSYNYIAVPVFMCHRHYFTFYSPSKKNIGGSSTITGDQNVGGSSTITGNSTVKGDLSVSGNSNLKDTTVNGSLGVTGNQNVGGSSTITGDQNVGGSSTITGKKAAQTSGFLAY